MPESAKNTCHWARVRYGEQGGIPTSAKRTAKSAKAAWRRRRIWFPKPRAILYIPKVAGKTLSMDEYFDSLGMLDVSVHIFAFLGAPSGRDYLHQRSDLFAARLRLWQWGGLHAEIDALLHGLRKARQHLDWTHNRYHFQMGRRFITPPGWRENCERTLRGLGCATRAASARVTNLSQFLKLYVEKPVLRYALSARDALYWHAGVSILTWPGVELAKTPLVLDLKWEDGRWKTAVKYRMQNYLRKNGLSPRHSLTRLQLVRLCMLL